MSLLKTTIFKNYSTAATTNSQIKSVYKLLLLYYNLRNSSFHQRHHPNNCWWYLSLPAVYSSYHAGQVAKTHNTFCLSWCEKLKQKFKNNCNGFCLFCPTRKRYWAWSWCFVLLSLPFSFYYIVCSACEFALLYSVHHWVTGGITAALVFFCLLKKFDKDWKAIIGPFYVLVQHIVIYYFSRSERRQSYRQLTTWTRL